MRTREEILKTSKNAPIDGNEDRTAALVEVLLDIRDSVEDLRKFMTKDY